MTRDHAISFISALNALQPYVPPMLFDRVANHPVAGQLALIAQGSVAFGPLPPESPPQASGDPA